MKPILWIPPLLALAVSAVAIFSQRRSISEMEAESVVLQTQIARAGTASGAGDEVAEDSAAASPGSREKKVQIPWKKLAGEMGSLNRGGTGDMRAMIRLQNQLQQMSGDELVRGLEEIAALGLPEQERAALEQMVLGALVGKDPEMALTKLVERDDWMRGGALWQTANAMAGWAKKDPAAATAWLDAQIAKGTFESKALDGRIPERIQVEGTLVATLLGTDPQAAAARIAALPEDQRSEVLNGGMRGELPEAEQAAFATVLRGQIPEAQQAQTIAEQAARFSGDDSYEKVTGFLRRLDATAAERAASVEQVGESQIRQLAWKQAVTATDVDRLRTWAAAEAPEAVDRTTGRALAAALQGGNDPKTKFADAAALAVKYHEASGNDEVLGTFLESWAVRRHQEEARALAEKISDPERREKILEQLK